MRYLDEDYLKANRSSIGTRLLHVRGLGPESMLGLEPFRAARFRVLPPRREDSLELARTAGIDEAREGVHGHFSGTSWKMGTP